MSSTGAGTAGQRSPASRWTAARASVRRGLGRTLSRGARRLASPFVQVGSLVFFDRDLRGPLPEAVLPAGFAAREVSAAELPAILAGSDPGRSREILAERFRRGQLCFAVADPEGRLVHTRWVCVEPTYVPELRRTLHPAPGDAYFCDGFTLPAARRRGLDGAVRCTIFRAMRERGFERAVSYARDDNPDGLRAAARWQRALGRVWYVRFARRATVLAGAASVAPLAFARERWPATDEGELSDRARSWREWFESWLEEPLARRSTGFSALPEEYFTATAGFIVAALDLDPGRDAVLDVGCDSAVLSRRVAPSCRSFTGLDLTPGLLLGAPRGEVRTGSGEAPRFVAADGRLLPLAAAAFDKVYCISTIHTLPSHKDGRRVLRELVRVCRPGGRILVGGVPDLARRWRARALSWRRGDGRERLGILATLLLPASLRAGLMRILGVEPRHRLVALDYDLDELRRDLLGQGVDCRELAFPDDFWSEDFRASRSNLLITVPPRPLPKGEAAAAAASVAAPASAAAAATALLEPRLAGASALVPERAPELRL